MSSRLRDIASSCLGRFGIPGIAEIHICADAAGGEPFSYWETYAHADKPAFHTDITTALAGMTTGRNDTMLLTPDNHTQVASITWNKNLTHLVGMVPPSLMNQRARIGHSLTADPLLDITGYGNLFANLYFMYGLANATDLNALRISGERNTLMNVHVLPTNATPLDEADFYLVEVNCNEGYIKDCVFGGDTVAWTDGDLLRLYGAADRSCRVIFEDCLFIMNADNAQVNFISTIAGMGAGVAFFKNCQFVNIGTSLTYAIDGAGLGNAKLYFDSRCSFAGVDDIVVVGNEADVWFGSNAYIAAATGNMLAVNPDVS